MTKAVKDFIAMMERMAINMKHECKLYSMYPDESEMYRHMEDGAKLTVWKILNTPEYKALQVEAEEEPANNATLLEYFKGTGREPMSKRDMIVLSEYLELTR